MTILPCYLLQPEHLFIVLHRCDSPDHSRDHKQPQAVCLRLLNQTTAGFFVCPRPESLRDA